MPETYFGLKHDASWKGLTLSLMFQDQREFNKFNHYDERRGEAGNYFQRTYNNRWTSSKKNTNIARAFNRNDFYWPHAVNMSTYWLENTYYCRLKNLVLSYQIPNQIFSRIGISNANVYFLRNNLGLL